MNTFRHQLYPATPELLPLRSHLCVDDAQDFDFSSLHTELGVTRVLIVHGTFMGDDPFGISDTLTAMANELPAFSAQVKQLIQALRDRCRPLTTSLTHDVGNYTPDFCRQFQQLVGPDPAIQLLQPTWSGQNHHLARADLAIRVAAWLLDQNPAEDERCLLWGHSHAGNGFALLSNLLANEPTSVRAFFDAAGNQSAPHWLRVREELAASPTPHPIAKHILVAAFGTPVRYGWDNSGLHALVHVLHDCGKQNHQDRAEDNRITDMDTQCLTQPLFPPHSLTDVLTARYGDWVQAFAIAGTDMSTLTSRKRNHGLQLLLEGNLAGLDDDAALSALSPLKLVPRGAVRTLCQRWTTGTRCHATGLNQLVSYHPSGCRVLGIPLEKTLLGHGVATTQAWLPVHLKLVMQSFRKLAGGNEP